MLPLGPPSCQQITHSHIGLLLTYIMAYSDGRLAFFPANHDPFWWQSLSIELWLGYVTSDYAGKHIYGEPYGGPYVTYWHLYVTYSHFTFPFTFPSKWLSICTCSHFFCLCSTYGNLFYTYSPYIEICGDISIAIGHVGTGNMGSSYLPLGGIAEYQNVIWPWPSDHTHSTQRERIGVHGMAREQTDGHRFDRGWIGDHRTDRRWT